MRRTSILLLTAAAALVVATNKALADDPPAPPLPAPITPPADGLAEQRELLSQKLAELERLQREIDDLRAATRMPSQILIHVEMLEVSRTKMRRLGLDVHDFTGSDIKPASFDADPKRPGETLLLENGSGIVEFIKALKENGVAKTLAEPTIATVTGRPAAFRVGGEFPVPLPPNSAELRKWGTQLEVLAEALGNDRVRLQLRAELSEPSDDGALIVEGHKVPSLRSRNCDTSCEMQFGETVVLGGLVTERIESEVRDGNPVEQVNEVEFLTVLHVEAVDDMAEVRTAPPFDPGVKGMMELRPGLHGNLPAPYSPPATATRRIAPHDSIRR